MMELIGVTLESALVNMRPPSGSFLLMYSGLSKEMCLSICWYVSNFVSSERSLYKLQVSVTWQPIMKLINVT